MYTVHYYPTSASGTTPSTCSTTDLNSAPISLPAPLSIQQHRSEWATTVAAAAPPAPRPPLPQTRRRRSGRRTSTEHSPHPPTASLSPQASRTQVQGLASFRLRAARGSLEDTCPRSLCPPSLALSTAQGTVLRLRVTSRVMRAPLHPRPPTLRPQERPRPRVSASHLETTWRSRCNRRGHP